MIAAVERVCNSVSIPVAVKLLPFITSLPNFAAKVRNAGAEGLVLFGREPIWEVFDGSLSATSRWSLSDSGQLQTTLSGLMRVRSGGEGMSIAASGGISTAKDVIHSVIAGADVAMVTSEIYRTGPDVVAHILEGVTQHLDRQGMHSFDEFVGSCRQGPSDLEVASRPGPRHDGCRTLSRSSPTTTRPHRRQVGSCLPNHHGRLNQRRCRFSNFSRQSCSASLQSDPLAWGGLSETVIHCVRRCREKLACSTVGTHFQGGHSQLCCGCYESRRDSPTVKCRAKASRRSTITIACA